MKVTAPHMGTANWLLEDLLPRLGFEFFEAPKTTERTIALGVEHAPEFACLPLKITLGNLIEGLEAGADATVFVGGIGPCRFGYYADVQRRILSGLGFDYTPIIIEPPGASYTRFVGSLTSLCPGHSYLSIWKAINTSFRKTQAFDRVDKLSMETRCYETHPGDTSKARLAALQVLRAAHTPAEIVEAEREALALVDAVDQDRDRDVLRVGIVGEYYVVLEPFVNFDIEEYLGARDCWLARSAYTSDWIGPDPGHPVRGIGEVEMERAADPYLSFWVGGDGQESVGLTAVYARAGYDGVVHFLPFTCMPDTIAKAILPLVSAREDIPVISFVVDEQTGRAGVHTRLEAFLDLLWSRHRARRRASA